MAIRTFIWGNTEYYKIEQHVPVMQSDAATGTSAIPATRDRAMQFALSDLRGLLAPNYSWSGSEIWTFEDLEMMEEDTAAMALSVGIYNVVYRIPKADAEAAAQQDYVLNNNRRPEEPVAPPTPQELADACPDRAAFAIHGNYYKVTVVLDDVDLELDPILNDAYIEAEFDAARQIAAHFNSSIPGNPVMYQSESPSGTYVGPPGAPGVRIQGLTPIMVALPSDPNTSYQCRYSQAVVESTGKFIGSYRAPVSGVTNVNVVPGDAAAPTEAPAEAPSEAPADAASPLGPDDANPDAPPGVEERDGNYVITVVVPDGEDASDEAKDQLAQYVTDSSRGSAANISIDGDLTELSSTPIEGSVAGKKILIIGDSQWDGTSMGSAVKDGLIAQGAEVRTLYRYGKGLWLGADYWGLTVNKNTGTVSISSSGLLASMLSSFRPDLVIVGLGGNDTYTFHNKKTVYQQILTRWIEIFQAAEVSEVRWMGLSYASKSGYDRLRQRIRDHQQELLSASPVTGIQTTWTDTTPFTRDLAFEPRDAGYDGVHFTGESAGYPTWGQRMTSTSGPLGDLMSGESAGARRMQYAVPIGNVQVTSKPPKGGAGYEPPPAEGAPVESRAEEPGPVGEINIEPIDFQCILMQNIRQLAKRHEEEPYQYIVRLNTEGSPGNVMSIIDHGNMTDEVRELLSLCPEVYGVLSPYLKITRVEYDEKGKVKKDSRGIPIEKELRIPNFVSERDVEDILAGGKSRISGAGIKKFSWELKGVQPAEVDNNITAVLEIYFQSVGDFFGGAAQAGGNVPNFLDLIINSPAVRQVKNKSGTGSQSPSKKPLGICPVNKAVSAAYDGANFRIKVCAGWAPPEDMESIFPTMPASKIKLLREAIMASRASLFLQQVRHNIQFNENGSMLLSIDYHAALSGLLRGSTADIFADGKAKDEIKKLREDKRILAADSADEDLGEKDKEALGEKTDELLKKIDELEQADKLQKYRMLLEGLFRSEKVMILELPAAEIYTKGIDQMTHEERVEFARTRQAPGYITERVNAGVFESSTLEAIPEEGGKTEDVGNRANREIERERRGDAKKIKKGDDDLIKIPYMYMGDIVDNVLNQIKINNGEQLNFKFFLSEVDLIDPLVAFQVKGFADYVACGNVKDDLVLDAMEAAGDVTVKGESGLVLVLNIGDIPISLDAFQKWFTDKVIKKSLDKYYFLNFIKDVSAQLISNALKGRCYGKKYKFFQRFDAQPVSLGDSRNLKKKGTIRVTTLANYKRKLTCETSADNTALGIVLMSTDSKPKSLRGDFEQDLKNGIYHNYIGSSCGLVKKISFNREDMPYLRESKIQKQGALGAAQLRELYSVNIDLVGNNLYRNGSYVYVSPLLLDTTMEELEFLGLHGYYMVTSVSSEITEASFTTSMRALHEGVKFPENRGASTAKDPPPPAPSANPAKEEEEEETPPAIRKTITTTRSGGSPTLNPNIRQSGGLTTKQAEDLANTTPAEGDF